MNEKTLDAFFDDNIKPRPEEVMVFVDNRELRSKVSQYLRELKVRVVEKQLSVGDYIVSDRVGIERKSVKELAGSIYTNRLFDECYRLKEAYEIPILVLEGYLPMIFKLRKINERSIWGAIASIAIELRMAIVPTPDATHTAKFIERIAYCEQVKVRRPVVIRPREKLLTLAQQQQYLICGLPNIGPTLAESLLLKADTPYNVFREIAETEVLKSKSGRTKRLSGPAAEVKGIGPVIVEKAKEVLTKPYSPETKDGDCKDKSLMSDDTITYTR